VIGIDCIGSYKSNYHTITITTVPKNFQILLISIFDYKATFFVLINLIAEQMKNIPLCIMIISEWLLLMPTQQFFYTYYMLLYMLNNTFNNISVIHVS
jgi:hypothetical protein